MKTNLKDNIFIEGFNKKDLQVLCGIEAKDSGYDLLYEGKTSEIPEELAKECVQCLVKHPQFMSWNNYRVKKPIPVSMLCNTAKESIQSACSKEYCIIYKVN